MSSHSEAKFQANLIKKLERMFPGCIVTKLDTRHRQGFPDLLILWKRFWATLECKSSREARSQPNQDHYIERLGEMSFAAYIYPENEEEVLNALQQAFKPPRRTRLSKSQPVSLDSLYSRSID